MQNGIVQSLRQPALGVLFLVLVIIGCGGGSPSARPTGSGGPEATPPDLGSPGLRPPINVRDEGATGDGVTDDTAAFSRAVAAAAAGGTVYVPVGTDRLSQVILPSGVALVGESRTGSVLVASGEPAVLLDKAETLVLSSGTTGVAVSDLSLVGHGTAGGAGDEILLGLRDTAEVTVRNVTLDHSQGRGLFAIGTGCTGGVYEDLLITNTFASGGRYGVGFWFYYGPSGNAISELTTDMSDGAGLALDAGSTVGSGMGINDNTITGITIMRAARQPGSEGVLVAGAQRNTMDGFRIHDTHAQGSVALSVQEDQTGVPSEGNVFSSGLISDVGRSAIMLQSASRNAFRDIAVSNVGLVEDAVLVELSATGIQGGLPGDPTADNTFERIELTQSAGAYVHGVLLDSSEVPIVRNRFASIGWARPSHGLVEIEGTHAPLTGPDANVGLNR